MLAGDGLMDIPDKFKNMPEECLHWIRVTGEKLAQYEALAEYHGEYRKTYLATLKMKLDGSDAKKDTEARASEDYQDYLFKTFLEVNKRHRFYKHQMNWLNQRLNAWQTECANDRRQLTSYKHG